MPVTTLDPRTALVVIDLQQGLRGYTLVHPIGEVIARAAALAAAFRRRGLPVVLVNAAGRPGGRTEQSRPSLAPPPDWMALVPELRAQPGDIFVTKTAPGAFGDSPLAAELRGRGVTQVVVVGVSTSQGVEATARGAYDLGFNVTLALDAMSDTDAQSHAASLRFFPRIAETGSTEDVLALLEQQGVPA